MSILEEVYAPPVQTRLAIIDQELIRMRQRAYQLAITVELLKNGAAPQESVVKQIGVLTQVTSAINRLLKLRSQEAAAEEPTKIGEDDLD